MSWVPAATTSNARPNESVWQMILSYRQLTEIGYNLEIQKRRKPKEITNQGSVQEYFPFFLIQSYPTFAVFPFRKSPFNRLDLFEVLNFMMIRFRSLLGLGTQLNVRLNLFIPPHHDIMNIKWSRRPGQGSGQCGIATVFLFSELTNASALCWCHQQGIFLLYRD